MDKAFNNGKLSLLRPITSVVVITLMAVLLFSVPQTYAMGTNEDFLENLGQNYQQASKLSDLIQKVFSFFSEKSGAQETINVQSISSDSGTVQNNTCKQEPIFVDIQNNEYKNYINILHSRGIVIGSSNKFFPNDDLRFYCMIKMVVDAYRSKIGYDFNTELGLSQKNYFSTVGTGIDKIFLKYLNTAYELGFLQGISDIDVSSKSYFEKNTSKSIEKQIFDNIYREFPLLVNASILNQIETGNDLLSRGNYAKNLVNFFEFKGSQGGNTCSEDWKAKFSDIMNHDYESDIQVLADLGIIDSQSYKFYPDNYLRKYEFIIMLTKTILKKENQELNIYVLDHTANISDLDPKSSYVKYFEYAYHNGFLEYGFDSSTEKLKVNPNGFITIDEINRTLSKLVKREVKFQAKSKDGLVTRGEFADMLVDGFSLDTNVQTINSGSSALFESSLLQEISGRRQSSKLLSKL